ncbi:MAG TPA: AgmX/PglI C-terminal domain-containing protein [Polyangiaceae bacterium]
MPYLVAAFVLFGIGGYLILRHEAKTPPPDGASSALDNADPIALPPTEQSGAVAANDAAPAKTNGMPELDRAKADAIRARLKMLYGGGEPPPITPPPKAANEQYPVMPSDPNDGTVLKEYIRARVKDDYFPLAKSCYENALAQKPNLAGKFVMKFTISGDRRVGGVVDSTEEDPATTMHDEQFSTCMKESMMSVSFDAPPKDGKVDVTYPIEFSPGDGGDSD